MFKKNNNSGWILCPSKSYPGKFYYFNVLNGEAAWSLNDNVKRVLKNEVTIEKVKKNYLYPEPVTPPDHPSSNYYSTRSYLPSFGQSQFPKYISNVKENIAIMRTPNQMPHLVTNTKKFDKMIQAEQDSINVHTCSIPLSKRFQNKINYRFDSMNYITETKKDWRNSTNIWSNISEEASKMQYKRKLNTKPFIKESKLKRLEHTNRIGLIKTVNQDSTQLHCNKFVNQKLPKILANLDVNDLRYVLKAKRRKSVENQDINNKFNKEHSTLNDTKRVTFNTTYDKIYSENTYTDAMNENTSAWYLVVDLDTLLEEYDCIKHYIDRDENCRLYIPTAIENQLKTFCMGEHGGRSRVIVARQLLRQLASNKSRLNLPEGKEDTNMNQIIKCCLEIMKRNYVELITKNIELLHAAESNKIRVHYINDIKYDLGNNLTYKNHQNLFLQNKSDFDPFTISRTVGETQYYCIDDTENKKCMEYNNYRDIYNNENNSDISDIIININKLKIHDNMLNIGRTVSNNLLDTYNKDSRYNIKNISKTDINITFSNRSDQEYTNIPLNIYKETDILEDMLKEYYIKDSTMEYNIYVRFDEWVCSYEQIIEDFLHIMLQKDIQQVSLPPPWFLHEGMVCLKEIYRDNKDITNIIEKLLYYYDFSNEKGTNIKPYNFMKLFGCGFYLVEAFEKSSPLHILDIKNKLIHLRDILEQPVEDLPLDSPKHYSTEDGHTYRCNFIKNPSYVLDYLKNNFIEWKNYKEVNDNTKPIEQEVYKDNVKVIRTFGKHLNKLAINKSKCLSFINETDKQTYKHNMQAHVFKNIQLDTYKEKLNKNYINPDTFNNSNEKQIKDKGTENNDIEIISLNNDVSVNDNNDSAKDSGFNSNSLHAYSLVRSFLSELSTSFKIIHIFIDESIKVYSEGIAEDNKKNLYEKANKTHIHIADVIEKLKIIIQRESIENSTLKSLLIKAGSDDKRTTRYRPVVMKCLEQAKILENSLKSLLAITNGDDKEVMSVSSEDIHFVNIYE